MKNTKDLHLIAGAAVALYMVVLIFALVFTWGNTLLAEEGTSGTGSGSNQSSTTGENPIYPDPPPNTGGSTSEPEIPMPDAHLVQPQNGFLVTGDISFNVIVEAHNAEEVVIYSSASRIGKASKESGNIWKKSMRAGQDLGNGTHTIFAKAINPAGVATSNHASIMIEIPDETPEETSSSGSTDTSPGSVNTATNSGGDSTASNTDTSTNTDSRQEFGVRIVSPAHRAIITDQNIDLVAEATNIDRLEFMIKKINSSSIQHAGSAKRVSANKWKYNLNIKERVPNGDYLIIAKATNGDGWFESDPVRISVQYPRDTSQNLENVSTETGLKKNTENTTNGENDIGSRETSTVSAADPENLDSDGDGIPDDKEILIGLNPNSRDTDKDGLPDKEELRLGTNPKSADSDRDGFLDGDEIRNGYNPLKYSSGDKSDKIIFQSPKEKGNVDDNYSVEIIELIQAEGEEKKAKLQGKGLPNSFVTLYIYSEKPIIVTVKTDENGSWSYELDKELEDGSHEVYVAVTDNTGKITSKSKSLAFVKTAEAVSIVTPEGNQSPLERSKNNIILFAVTTALIFVSVALALIGIIVSYKHRSKNEGFA